MLDHYTLTALRDVQHALSNLSTILNIVVELSERTDRLAQHLKPAVREARDALNAALILLPVLALLVCTGCAPSWRSEAMVDALQSPLVGEVVRFETWPGYVEFTTPDPAHLAQNRALKLIPQRPYTLECWDITITGEFW